MSKKLKIMVISILLVVSLALSFTAGCTLGTTTVSDGQGGLEVVTEAWGIIFQEYVDKSKLEATALSQAAIEGMVKELDDPYTSYLDARAYRLSQDSLKGKFDGIGAYVGIKDEKIIIVAPMPNSPAAKAGIKAGDVILAINGQATAKMRLDEAVAYIRGPKGTSVQLRVLHRGETEAKEIEIVRAEIELSSVNFEMKGDVAYINLAYFSERSDKELSSALENIDQKRTTGIILDLRGNPGGLLEAVVDVASHFLEKGTAVVHVVDNQGKQTSLFAKSTSIVTELPLVVLTDNYSASGSEVLAGALQDHARAIIVGTTTYGKGSVNTQYQLKDGSGLYITTARWLTPNGRLIEGEGINPDYELKPEGEDALQWAIDYLKGRKG